MHNLNHNLIVLLFLLQAYSFTILAQNQDGFYKGALTTIDGKIVTGDIKVPDNFSTEVIIRDDAGDQVGIACQFIKNMAVGDRKFIGVSDRNNKMELHEELIAINNVSLLKYTSSKKVPNIYKNKPKSTKFNNDYYTLVFDGEMYPILSMYEGNNSLAVYYKKCKTLKTKLLNGEIGVFTDAFLIKSLETYSDCVAKVE